MRRYPVALLFAGAVLMTACSSSSSSPIYSSDDVQFWRPISEPNALMASDALQKKLEFDLSQCHCGVFPTNTTHNETVKFQKDKQRYAQTSVTVTPGEEGSCQQKPALVVTECMRARGWEPTTCSGRMPLPGGGSLCAAYKQPDAE